MAKATTHFVCSECGYDSVKWYGKCPGCGEWNTMQEFDTAPRAVQSKSARTVRVENIKDIDAAADGCFSTGYDELDRALGGGIYEGACVLIGGEPGIGKSTLFLQSAACLSRSGRRVLYVTGEESPRQIKLRANRVCEPGNNLLVAAETDVDSIVEKIGENSPAVAVVDSIQTLTAQGVASSAGSVTQIRECAARLIACAKTTGTAVFLIGHVTKEGTLAGPRVLEHMVDTVLYFEGAGEFRILRAVKNRYGSVNEIGVFEMTGEGLKCVPDFSAAFITQGRRLPGSCLYCALEGSRPVLVEIQALCAKSAFNNPRRLSAGIDYNRTMLMSAVLERRAGVALYDQDMYLNAAGGLKVSEPACDLACAIAVVSSVLNVETDVAAMGELGLTGEVRGVPQLARRLAECARMGIKRVAVSARQAGGLTPPPGMEIIPAKSLYGTLCAVFGEDFSRK